MQCMHITVLGKMNGTDIVITNDIVKKASNTIIAQIYIVCLLNVNTCSDQEMQYTQKCVYAVLFCLLFYFLVALPLIRYFLLLWIVFIFVPEHDHVLVFLGLLGPAKINYRYSIWFFTCSCDLIWLNSLIENLNIERDEMRGIVKIFI